MMVKIGIEQLPLSYSFLKDFGLTLFGGMERPQYAYDIFMHHFKCVPRISKNFTALELGPGDSLSSGLIAHALGASKTYLVDAGNYAERKAECYKQLVRFLGQKGLNVSDLERCKSLDDYLMVSNCKYLTSGLASLRTIPDSTIDFIWSNAVLEHVRKTEFLETLTELRRIIKPYGVSSHVMDMRDHMNESLNHLRISTRLWNSHLVRTSNFTNRIRFQEALGYFRLAGFEPKIVKLRRWSQLPVPKKDMAREFRTLSDEDLRVWDFHALLYPI
jgi:SAM-dependent methyltransferase